MAADPYISRSEMDTVAVELVDGTGVLASVNTVLGVEHVSEARALAAEIASGLESGALQPTAGAIEPLAARMPRSGGR